jgi:hypothetical protein
VPRRSTLALGNRSTAVPSSQSPSSSPFSAPENLDVIGERKDGGVDLLVVTSAIIDDSDETCRRLEEKLATYLFAATHENFARVYPAAGSGRTRIFVSDRHQVSDRARRLVENFARQAMSRNVEVQIGSPVV